MSPLASPVAVAFSAPTSPLRRSKWPVIQPACGYDSGRDPLVQHRRHNFLGASPPYNTDPLLILIFAPLALKN
jgi:hypothetical protein